MSENLIKMIDQWAITEPTKVAYDYLGKTNTYADLKAYSDSLAAYLQQMALPKGAPLIVFGGQKFEMIAAFLAAVKTGHAYIPVDTHSPLERVEIIKEIAQPAACIAVDELPLKFTDLPVITPTQLNEIFAIKTPYHDVANYVSGDENFYIIFTSGTTGVPKGVQISHDNLVSFNNWMQTDFGLSKDGVCLSQPPYSFDLSVMDLYPTLTAGKRLAVLPKETTDNFKELFSVLPELQVSEWVSTPSFMDICLLQPTFDAKHLPALTHFFFCGEELTHKTAATLKQRFPQAKIFNTYGPTEATVAVSAVEITSEVLENYQRLPIGKAKQDTQIVLLDENGKEVATGESGEILIVGPSVSKGYLNNSEKTAKAFVTYNARPAYKTGDLGQFDENGQLLYKGRIDFQIKLHGFRIELEDVDHHLDKVSYVSQATTVPHYGKDHKVNQLVAYVVKDKDKTAEFESDFKVTQAIKKELLETMMSYMMPQKFVYVDSLPLTANGKIDRKSLMKEVNS
ncbi:D-alanine--poly(phosphoribitol) ligase subunit DltA [Ligilactobacillus apodemi]|uniref:D-alanine--poly(phosphoribitol) ligase subunit DltA n=1 Tax=Ligilactobacillus apodemi TaxID=307126 RepID=UPI00214CF1AE|nr:D-alanine--poly(phosphoribitol) ligase subunit DltA [Ligilactobacillus apodemi]MCR1900548.1 D-alanine--poly(phosphoribitol) ligase subunit DltA [Ligilactobacillus apodemi]